MLDTNNNNQIEFSEFKAAMLKTTLYLQGPSLRKAFKFFDRDNSGNISKQELMAVFETFADLLSMFETDDYDLVIAQVDKNRDGKISYDEFVRFMCSELEDSNCQFNL